MRSGCVCWFRRLANPGWGYRRIQASLRRLWHDLYGDEPLDAPRDRAT